MANREMVASTNKQMESMEHESVPKEARDIDLKLFTTTDRGWPRGNFTGEDLNNSIKNNIYKWTFEDSKYTNTQVLKLITKDDIKLNDCWLVVENIYRKLRPGITQDRSPLEKRDPRLRKLTQCTRHLQ